MIPLVYRSVVMNDYRYPPKASLEQYGHYVQNLLVVSFSKPKIPEETILACCSNVHNLAFWNEVHLTERVFDLTKLTHLFTRSLAFFKPYYSSLFPDAQSDPLMNRVPRAKIQHFFSTITHLALYDRLIIDMDELISRRILQACTSLTHLLVYSYTSDHALRLALEFCPNIQVLICLDCPYTDSDRTFVLASSPGDDRRIVMMDGHFTSDWKRGVLGEKDMWTMGDEVMAQRISERDSH